MGQCTIPRPIRAVFFDLDDTLLQTTDADNSAMEEVATKLAETHPKISWTGVHSAWATAFKEAPWDSTYQVPVEEWRAGLWSRALADHGVNDDALGTTLQSCFTSGRTNRFKFTTEVQEVMKEIRARGYKVVLITNGHAEVQRGKIEATQALAAVGGNVLVGGEELAAGRHEKPHASIFHSACRLVGCEPHEAVHVGDSLASDIQGGINAGLAATIWISPLGAAAPKDGPRPTFTIKHVDALLPVLKRLSERQGGSRDERPPKRQT